MRVGTIRRSEQSGYGETAACAAVERLFARYAGSGSAMFVSANARCWRGAGKTDYPFAAAADEPFYSGGFIGLSGFGGHRWTIGASGLHPVMTTDAGSPVLAFGRDGGDQNNLSAATNGDIVPLSVADGYGSEISRRPLFQAGTGWSLFAKFRTGATGAILGSAADNAANPFVFGVHPDTQQLVIRNQLNSDGLLVTGTWAGGTTQMVIATYDASTGTMTLWSKNISTGVWEQNAQVAGLVDLLGTGDTRFPKIGGYTASASGWPYNGYLSALGYLPSPVLVNALKRIDVQTMLEGL
jgi:hypothetical protein